MSSEKSDTLVFHARPSKEEKNPSHTLCFHIKNNLLLCTYSKPHPGLEAYCKVTGRDLTERRMQTFIKEVESSSIAGLIDNNLRNLSKYAPSCVRKTLKYYTNCAIRYFKLDKNPTLVLRGQFADWETYMAKGKTSRVPVTAIWLSTEVDKL